jgi:hypothetical protein
MGTTARLHEELEPLVAAISALAESMQPRATTATTAPAAAPAIDALPDDDPPGEDIEWIEPLTPVHAGLLLPDDLDDDEVDDDGNYDDGHEVVLEPVTLYDFAEDDVFDEPEPEPAPAAPTVVGAPAADATNAPQALRPWRPHEEVTGILEALAEIDTHPTRVPIPGAEPIDVLPPDELVDAVASALTVAPATVRHWLSNDTLQAATRAIEAGPQDAENLVRERQVLAAQVEVLKRALSDLG